LFYWQQVRAGGAVMMYGYGSNGGWGWGAWVFMAIMMLVFFAAVAAVIIALIRSSGRGGTGATAGTEGGAQDALRLLDERFARGDIDADEYTTRRDLLRSR
jgi:putative membrane protein